VLWVAVVVEAVAEERVRLVVLELLGKEMLALRHQIQALIILLLAEAEPEQ